MKSFRRLDHRWALASALVIVVLGAMALSTARTSAMPILGQYPTGNLHLDYTDVTQPLTTTWNNIAIDHVGAGLIDISGERIEGLAYDADDGDLTTTFEMTKDLDISIVANRGRNVSVSGDASAELRSPATEAVFLWEPLVSGAARCADGEPGGGRSPLEGCTEVEVHLELTGDISGPDGRGTCGSLETGISFVIVLDQDGEGHFGGFTGDQADTVHGTGQLDVSDDSCAGAVYGVMPGDNVTMTAWVSVSGATTDSGRSAVWELEFDGVLRDRTPVSGTVYATLTIRGNTAVGEVTRGEVRIDGAEPVDIEGGTLTLEDVQTRGDTLIGTGILEFFPSETEGSTDD